VSSSSSSSLAESTLSMSKSTPPWEPSLLTADEMIQRLRFPDATRQIGLRFCIVNGDTGDVDTDPEFRSRIENLLKNGAQSNSERWVYHTVSGPWPWETVDAQWDPFPLSSTLERPIFLQSYEEVDALMEDISSTVLAWIIRIDHNTDKDPWFAGRDERDLTWQFVIDKMDSVLSRMFPFKRRFLLRNSAVIFSSTSCPQPIHYVKQETGDPQSRTASVTISENIETVKRKFGSHVKQKELWNTLFRKTTDEIYGFVLPTIDLSANEIDALRKIEMPGIAFRLGLAGLVRGCIERTWLDFHQNLAKQFLQSRYLVVQPSSANSTIADRSLIRSSSLIPAKGIVVLHESEYARRLMTQTNYFVEVPNQCVSFGARAGIIVCRTLSFERNKKKDSPVWDPTNIQLRQVNPHTNLSWQLSTRICNFSTVLHSTDTAEILDVQICVDVPQHLPDGAFTVWLRLDATSTPSKTSPLEDILPLTGPFPFVVDVHGPLVAPQMPVFLSPYRAQRTEYELLHPSDRVPPPRVKIERKLGLQAVHQNFQLRLDRWQQYENSYLLKQVQNRRNEQKQKSTDRGPGYLCRIQCGARNIVSDDFGLFASHFNIMRPVTSEDYPVDMKQTVRTCSLFPCPFSSDWHPSMDFWAWIYTTTNKEMSEEDYIALHRELRDDNVWGPTATAMNEQIRIVFIEYDETAQPTTEDVKKTEDPKIVHERRQKWQRRLQSEFGVYELLTVVRISKKMKAIAGKPAIETTSQDSQMREMSRWFTDSNMTNQRAKMRFLEVLRQWMRRIDTPTRT
jgi:hypothetical protein